MFLGGMHASALVRRAHPVFRATAKTDYAVLGGGLAGLVIAAHLTTMGGAERTTLLLQPIASGGIEGLSGWIQSDIFHQPDSLASRLTIRGRQTLYDRCATNNIPHLRKGKLVVATSNSQVPHLDLLQTRSLHPSLRTSAQTLGSAQSDSLIPAYFLSGNEARELEPVLGRDTAGAVILTEAGVLDLQALARDLRLDMDGADARPTNGSGRSRGTGRRAQLSGHGVAVQANVGRVYQAGDEWVIECDVEGEKEAVRVDRVVQLDGIGEMEQSSRPNPPMDQYTERYLACDSDIDVGRHIYPSPMRGSDMSFARLNVTLENKIMFGPILLARNAPPLSPEQITNIARAIQTYLPSVDASSLSEHNAEARNVAFVSPDPDGAGAAGEPVIHSEAGLVDVYGLDSLGPAGAMGAAQHVAELLGLGKRPSLEQMAEGWE